MSKINYKKLKEKLASQPEEFLTLGQEKGYFVLDGNKIKYLASDKKYNFADPEEKVRARYYFDLIEKYKYPPERIEFEVEMPDRTPDRSADIVIYEDFAKKMPYIVIECKKDGITDAEFEQAVKQVISNARVLKAQFAVCVAGNTRRAIETEKWNDKEPQKPLLLIFLFATARLRSFAAKKRENEKLGRYKIFKQKKKLGR